jgi:hypothetical protein
MGSPFAQKLFVARTLTTSGMSTYLQLALRHLTTGYQVTDRVSMRNDNELGFLVSK